MAEFSDAKSGAYCMCTREKCSDECRTYRRFRPKPITNADRIRAMSDEKLAEFLKEQTSLAHNYGYECADGEPDFPDGIPADYNYLTWLREEVTDG